MGTAELGSNTVREVARDAEVSFEFDLQRGSPYRTVAVLRSWLALVPGTAGALRQAPAPPGGPRVVVCGDLHRHLLRLITISRPASRLALRPPPTRRFPTVRRDSPPAARPLSPRPKPFRCPASSVATSPTGPQGLLTPAPAIRSRPQGSLID